MDARHPVVAGDDSVLCVFGIWCCFKCASAVQPPVLHVCIPTQAMPERHCTCCSISGVGMDHKCDDMHHGMQHIRMPQLTDIWAVCAAGDV